MKYKDIRSLEGNIIKIMHNITINTYTTRLTNTLYILNTREMIKINKMNFFLILFANGITNNLIEEVPSIGTVWSDSNYRYQAM